MLTAEQGFRSCGSDDTLIKMLTVRAGSRGFWRPLIGVVVGYAVAAQSLLIALGGFAVPAHSGDVGPAFVLCLHGGQRAPESPARNPDHSQCTHCIFCFAESHHALTGSPPVLFHRVAVETSDVTWAADKHCVPHLSAYSIASPRGPPLRA